MKKHAKLSASSSSRWLKCTASIKACEAYEDKPSAYALEGTDAHTLADICLSNNTDTIKYLDDQLPLGTIATNDMCTHVQNYIDYVRGFEKLNTEFLSEQRVYYSSLAPEGGTLDAAVIDLDNLTCHIFDLKYGIGVSVVAQHNTQGMLYALGLYKEMGWLNIIEKFVIHICQPRKNNFTSWAISTEELLKFEKFANKQGKEALSDKSVFNPGIVQCRFCSHAPYCKALYEHTHEVIAPAFDDLDSPTGTLSQGKQREILDNADLIKSFILSVHNEAYALLKSGNKFEGYKLVEAKVNRKWSTDAEEFLNNKLGNEAYEQKLIGIIAAEKLLSKLEVSKICYKPQAKLVLAPNSDKREAKNVGDEFTNLDQ